MIVDLVIKDGLLELPDGLLKASLVINEGKIIGIVKSGEPKADQIVDASGKLILPGMVDTHLHLRDPGFPKRETFETATRGAAAGGITTVIDMPNTVPSVITAKALNEKRSLVEAKSLVDFGLIGGAGDVTKENIVNMAEAGACSFKSFLIPRFKELAPSDYQLYKHMETVGSLGLSLLVHAENGHMVDCFINEAKNAGRVDPIAHCEYRSSIAEVEATQKCITLASFTNCHLHICHMTAAKAVDILEQAQKRGQVVSGETSINYLLMTSEMMNVLGPYAKMDPPLRSKADQKRLWDAINTGVINVIASDHAPYTKEEKEKGWKNIFDAPSGAVGIETTLPLMLDAVNNGRITIERLVEIFSKNPAQLNGLYPNKGSIRVGSDADLLIVDMDTQFTISGENLHTKQKYTPFEGRKGKGVPIMTYVRGKLIYRDGQVYGKPGYGQFVRP